MKEELKLAAAFLLASNIVIGTLYLFLKCGGGSADRTALGTHASDSTAIDKDSLTADADSVDSVKTLPADNKNLTAENKEADQEQEEDEVQKEDAANDYKQKRKRHHSAANRGYDFDRRPPRGYRPGARESYDPMMEPGGVPRSYTQPQQRPGQPQQRPGQPQQRPGQSQQRSGQSQQRPGLRVQPQLGDRPSESLGPPQTNPAGDRKSNAASKKGTPPSSPTSDQRRLQKQIESKDGML